MAGLVHACQLEDEVGKSANICKERYEHAQSNFLPSPVSSHEEDEDGDGYGSDGQTEFSISHALDDDQELHSKAEEEEEIELQQSNVNLRKLNSTHLQPASFIPERSNIFAFDAGQR